MSASGKFSLKIKDYIQTPERKREYNEQHFGEAASRYDIATRAMSLGRDSAWKRQLIAALPEMHEPLCVDLACGTGDVAYLLAGKYPHGRVIGIDLTEGMLELARKRHPSADISFERGDMGCTRFDDSSVDVLTGSYAVRNAPDLRQAFSEIRRILKPEGVVALLDFSKPPQRWFQRLQYYVLKTWCGFWGLLLHGNPEVHSYIAASLKTYPDRDELRTLMADCGFQVTAAKRFYFGTLELLVLEKTGLGHTN